MKNKFFVEYLSKLLFKNSFSVILISFQFITYNVYSQDFLVSESESVVFGVDIDADSSGNFILVWDDSRNVRVPFGGTGSENDIYAQRFDSEGLPLGTNFRISDDSSFNDVSFAGQFFPRIAMNKNGEFVVAWVDNRTNEFTASGNFNIFAQIFDEDGNTIGKNFLVNDSSYTGQLNPDISVREDGSFVIIWVSPIENSSIYLQAFNSNGAKIGSSQKLLLAGQQPRLAQFENGNFIVVGDSNAQIFSFPSNELIEPFKIPMGYTKDVQISYDNKIIIAQMENRIIENQLIDSDVFLYQYDNLGNFIIRTQVNDDSTDYWQVQPSLSINYSDILVVWQDYRNGYETGDGKCIDIYGQRFSLDISRIGTNIKISHEENNSGQFNPTAVVRNGKIYSAWLDGRKREYYPNVHPPISKIDVWATIQDFNSPIEGEIIDCDTIQIIEPPSGFNFFNIYPNPANSNYTFSYDLPQDSDIKIILYNILGESVKILLSDFQAAGHYKNNFLFKGLSSGVYFVRIIVRTLSGSFLSGTQKVTLIK